MRMRDHILSILNTSGNFFSDSSAYLQEKADNIEHAYDPILFTIFYAVQIQCVANKRTEEICRIAKECTSINFSLRQYDYNSTHVIKGRGANSELFGNTLINVVNIISHQSGVKSSSVNKLFALLTPVILSDLYFNYKAKNYTYKQLAAHLAVRVRGDKKLKNELKREMLSLLHKEPIQGFNTTRLHTLLLSGHPPITIVKNIYRSLLSPG